MSGLKGARVLIVGGSAGIGQETGLAAANAGAKVAFAARRADKLDQLVSRAGAGCIAVPLDVRDEASIQAGIAQAVDQLGGLDAVVHSAGMARMGTLADENADRWREVLETNVIGAALVARDAVPHLAASPLGLMLFCSSTSDDQPRWGLSAYSVSKAALNRLIEGLRHEHRDVRFIRTTIGSTIGTEFGNNFDGELLTQALAQWVVSAQATAKMMTAPELGQVLAELLELLLSHPDIDMPQLRLEPPGGTLTLPATPDMLTKFYESMPAS